MAQQRFLDFQAPESTELLNGKWLNAEGDYLARGLDVSSSVQGPWQVDISAGVAVIDGVAIEETETLEGEVTLDSANSAEDRYDIIVMEYEYDKVEDGVPPKAHYSYRKGAPAAQPTPPNAGTNEIKLADIFIPAATTEIVDQNISNVGKWAQGVSTVFRQGDPSKRFTSEGMKTALLNYEGLFAYGTYDDRPEPWRYPGLVYFSTDKALAHYSDGDSWNNSSVALQSGLLEERPNPEVKNMVYIRLDADQNVESIDWSDGNSWHSASLGEGDYALDPHGNEAHDKTFLSADSTHGNAQHNPNFAEDPHNNEAHSENYSPQTHDHALGELSNVDASGEGDGGGFDSDQVDGEDAEDLASAVGSDSDRPAKRVDWSNVENTPSVYTPSDHSSSHTEGGSDSLPWGAGNGLDVDMVDGKHADDFAGAGHVHSLGDLSNVTASGEGEDGGLNADLLDGKHASEFQPAGDYAAGNHGNEDHSKEFLTEVKLTEQFNAGQKGEITAVPNLVYPLEADNDYIVKKIVARSRVAPADAVDVSVKIDGSTLETVTLAGEENRVESTSQSGTAISTGSVIGFSVDSGDSQGRDLMAALFVEETIS